MVAFSKNLPDWTRDQPTDRECAITAKCERISAKTSADQVLRATGNLRDDAAIHRLRRRCEQLAIGGQQRLLLDLREVTDADSRLVAVPLVSRFVQQTGGQCELRASEPVRDWIRIYGVDRLLFTERALRSVGRRV